MLILNALAATFVVPAWIVTFRPKFISAAAAQHSNEETAMERKSVGA